VSYSSGNWVVLFSDDAVVVLEPGAAEIPAALSDALSGIRGLNTIAAVSRKLLTWDTRLRCDLVAVFDPTAGVQLVVRGGLVVRDAETGAVVADGRAGMTWRELDHVVAQLHVEFETREGIVPASPLPLGMAKAGALRIDLRGEASTLSSFPASLALAPGALPSPIPPLHLARENDYHYQEPSPPIPTIAGPIVTPPNPGYQQAATLPAPVPDWLRDQSAPPPLQQEVSRAIPNYLQPIVPLPQEYSRPIPVQEQYSQPIPVFPQEYSRPIPVPEPEYSQPIPVPQPDHASPVPMPSLELAPPISVPPQDRTQQISVRRTEFEGNPPTQEWKTEFLPVTKLDTVKPPASGPTPTVGTGAVLSFSDGRVVPIDGKLVIGRAPKSDAPGVKTFKVSSPNHDVSRSHVSIEPKGNGWLVSDLASTNGTLVRRPSAVTVIAAEGTPVQVGIGTLISLGDGVVLRIDPA
jgi:hypothetical protein